MRPAGRFNSALWFNWSPAVQCHNMQFQNKETDPGALICSADWPEEGFTLIIGKFWKCFYCMSIFTETQTEVIVNHSVPDSAILSMFFLMLLVNSCNNVCNHVLSGLFFFNYNYFLITDYQSSQPPQPLRGNNVTIFS